MSGMDIITKRSGMNKNEEEEDNTTGMDVVVLICPRPRGLLDVWAMSMGRVLNLVFDCRGATTSR